MNNPQVSIFCVTYNQQDYIAKCIEGVLEQVINFNYVLIISDDFSNDKTAEICLEYQNRCPEKIFFSRNEKNLGVNQNFIKTYERCLNTKSKYIAQIAGDDYWTDPLKLQKQFDLMEAHQEVTLCYTNAYSFVDGNEAGREIMIKDKPQKNIFDLDLFIQNGGLILALTVFFRSDAFPNPVPGFLFKSFASDWALNILIMEKGKAAYIDEITAMYRVHPGGVTSSTYFPDIARSAIQLGKNLDIHFDYKYHKYFANYLNKYKELTVFYFQKKIIFKGIYYYLICFFTNPVKTIKDKVFYKTLFNVTFRGFEVFN